MKKQNQSPVLFALIFSVSLALSCQKSEETTSDTQDSQSNMSQSAMGIAGGIATDSEAGTFSRAACLFSSVRSCVGAVGTLDWNSCTIGTITMSGGWTNTYGGAGQCTNNLNSVLGNGDTVTRTSTGSVATFASGATLTTDTVAHTAWDGTSIPGTGIDVAMTLGTRAIQIHGLRRILRGPGGGVWFNHSFVGNMAVTGTRAGGDRVVSGILSLYHNIASVTATHTFNAVTWGTPTCCYPTSGNIATSLSSGGSVTLAFTATCGAANFTNTVGAISAITLSYCE